MKVRSLITVTVFLAICVASFAQQNLFISQNIESAVVSDDNTVIFRFIAPDAHSVQIAGDFVQTTEASQRIAGIVGCNVVDMQKGEDGVWFYKTQPLPSEFYSYVFLVDGVATIDPNNPHVFRDSKTICNVFLVGHGQADLYAVKDVPHGTLRNQWYHSDGIGYDRRLNVYTPAGYESNPEKRYPVLYLLHGGGGDEDEWILYGRACQIMDNLIAQGKTLPMIVVMPNGHAEQSASLGQSSAGYVKNNTTGVKPEANAYEYNFMEIVNFIDSNYRTIADKSGRAIAGLSMGGGHTINIARTFPGTFDYVGMFSSGIQGEINENIPINKNYMQTLQNMKDKGLKMFWFSVGNKDTALEHQKNLRLKFEEIDLPYTYVETSGGHVWLNWRIFLSQYTQLLFR